METKNEVQEKKVPAVVGLNDWDFFVAFTNYFGIRRATELMGMCVLWQAANIVGLLDLPTMSPFVAEATERGVSKSATYRAMADLRRFGDWFEPLADGVPLSVLIDLILTRPASPIGETVVQS